MRVINRIVHQNQAIINQQSSPINPVIMRPVCPAAPTQMQTQPPMALVSLTYMRHSDL